MRFLSFAKMSAKCWIRGFDGRILYFASLQMVHVDVYAIFKL